jgi:hypothetical protein
LSDDEEDDDEDDEDYEKVNSENNLVSDSSINEQHYQEQEEEDDDDLLGFGAFFDIFSGEDDSLGDKQIKVTSTQSPTSFTIPILPLTSATVHSISESSISKNPISALVTIESTVSPIVTLSRRPLNISTANYYYKSNFSNISLLDDSNTETIYYPLNETTKNITEKIICDSTTSIIDNVITELNNTLDKNNTNNVDKVKVKKIKSVNKRIISGTLQSVNTINNDTIKIQETHHSVPFNDNFETDYDFDTSQDDENDEFENNNEKGIVNKNEKEENDDTNKQVESAEILVTDDIDYEEEDNDDETEEEEDDDDDHDDDEAAVQDFVVNDQNKSNDYTNKYIKNKNQILTNKTNILQEYDTGDTYGLTNILTRKQNLLKL